MDGSQGEGQGNASREKLSFLQCAKSRAVALRHRARCRAKASHWLLWREQPHHQETRLGSGLAFQMHLGGASFQAPRNAPLLNCLKMKYRLIPCFILRVWHPLKCKYLSRRSKFLHLHLHISMKELLYCFLRTSFDTEKD